MAKNLSLRTTQNVVIEYQAATLMERILAGLIDMMLIGGISIFTVYMLSDFFDRLGVDRAVLTFVGLVPVVIMMLYHVLSETLAGGQSPGKIAMGIRVVRVDGQRASLREALIRALLFPVDFLFDFGIIGSFAIAVSDRNQRLGDMAANTVVIKSKPTKPFRLQNIMKIEGADEYEPTYPQVLKYTEEDMLVIKRTLEMYNRYPNTKHKDAFVLMLQKLAEQLELEQLPRNKKKFVETVLKDYIVLTR